MSTVPINQPLDITAPTPRNTLPPHSLPPPRVPPAQRCRTSLRMLSPQKRPPMFTTPFLVSCKETCRPSKQGSGYVESLPDGVKKTIEALKNVQVKQNELRNQYKRECLELEKKSVIRVPTFYPFMSTRRPLPPLFLLSVESPIVNPNNATLPLWVVGQLCLGSFVPPPQPNCLRSEIGNDRRE
jgi:hypothetical protein